MTQGKSTRSLETIDQELNALVRQRMVAIAAGDTRKAEELLRQSGPLFDERDEALRAVHRRRMDDARARGQAAKED